MFDRQTTRSAWLNRLLLKTRADTRCGSSYISSMLPVADADSRYGSLPSDAQWIRKKQARNHGYVKDIAKEYRASNIMRADLVGL